MKNLSGKKKLYVPLLTLTLSAGILAACSEQADAAVPNTPIAATVINASNTAAANIISEADAKKIAFDHVGIKEEDVTFLKVKLDYDDNKVEYDVEFYVGNTEYDFDINAATGAIRSFDFEIEEDFNYTISGNSISANTPVQKETQGSGSSQGISASDAKKIALAQVPGASESNIKDFEADMDDGRLVYEGEIRYNGMEYEFEIDAATGVILDWDAEYDD